VTAIKTKSLLAMSILFIFVNANAEPKAINVNYSENSSVSHQDLNQGALKKELAKHLVSQYYNNNGMWSRMYEIQEIRKLRIEYFGDRRAVVHVEYSYKPLSPELKQKSGVDRRDFIFVKHSRNRWTVISMGRHMSGALSR